MTSKDAETLPAWLGWARLAVGLAQGVGLYWLSELHPPEQTAWQAALWATLWLIPVLIVGGLGSIRTATLAIWTVIAIAMAAGIAWYEVDRLPEGEFRNYGGPPIAFLVLPVLLFVGHHLVAAGDEARRWIAPYERYFDLGWRHGAQILLALLFTGAFWAVLMIGAAMFDMIGLTFLRRWISETWFAFPATCIVFAAAVHLTDLRSGLVRGARALGLVLLSWLLPAMTGLAAAFFIALPFTGLEPLWATRAATAILLSAAAMLVILVNAAYQDGINAPNIVLRWSARLASLLMTPLAVLAAYALYLRIDQYGLTPERIYALALLSIGACYAVSYAIGAFWPRWMKPLEMGNLISAVVVLVVAVALFTPIADPARLSVANQMQRLASGAVSAVDFDVVFLRRDGAQYGEAALRRLRADQSTEERRELAQRAARALAMRSRWESLADAAPRLQPLFINMRPAGAVLPEGFGTAELGGVIEYTCRDQLSPCYGYLADLDSDGVNEVLVRAHDHMIWVYAQVGPTRWAPVGSIRLGAEDRDALDDGELRVVPARVGDVMVGGRRLTLNNEFGSEWPADAPASPDDGAAPNR